MYCNVLYYRSTLCKVVPTSRVCVWVQSLFVCRLWVDLVPRNLVNGSAFENSPGKYCSRRYPTVCGFPNTNEGESRVASWMWAWDVGQTLEFVSKECAARYQSGTFNFVFNNKHTHSGRRPWLKKENNVVRTLVDSAISDIVHHPTVLYSTVQHRYCSCTIPAMQEGIVSSYPTRGRSWLQERNGVQRTFLSYGPLFITV